MKKYVKPQIEKLEITDIIVTRSVFEGIVDLDKSSGVNWNEGILDPKENF